MLTVLEIVVLSVFTIGLAFLVEKLYRRKLSTIQVATLSLIAAGTATLATNALVPNAGPHPGFVVTISGIMLGVGLWALCDYFRSRCLHYTNTRMQ